MQTTTLTGKISWFGGPQDTGVSSSEGLACWEEVEIEKAPAMMFLTMEGMGLARRLNPHFNYCALRFTDLGMSRAQARKAKVKIRSMFSGVWLEAMLVDWGPNKRTGRVVDVSPGMMGRLRVGTDDSVVVEVTW